MEKRKTTQNNDFSISWGWVLALFIFFMWVLSKMSTLDTYQTVMGTIGGTIGIVVVIGQGFQWIRNFQIKRRPWRVTFSSKTRDQIKNDWDMSNKIKVPIGEHRILLRILTLRPCDLTEISIRPVKKPRFNFSENEPLEILKVENEETEEPISRTKLDNTFGIKLYYNKKFEKPAGYLVHYYVTVKAKRKWNGYVMFSAMVNDTKRYAYGKIEIN